MTSQRHDIEVDLDLVLGHSTQSLVNIIRDLYVGLQTLVNYNFSFAWYTISSSSCTIVMT